VFLSSLQFFCGKGQDVEPYLFKLWKLCKKKTGSKQDHTTKAPTPVPEKPLSKKTILKTIEKVRVKKHKNQKFFQRT
jgi:hypothetical protein